MGVTIHKNTLMTGCVVISVAFLAEAKSIIEYYRLRKYFDSKFIIFVNESKTIYLVLTGKGKLKAAMALMHLYNLVGEAVYINIGIAGGSNAPIGSLAMVAKLTDYATQKVYYPSLLHRNRLSVCYLKTVDIPLEVYPLEEWVDMEASGFYEAAIFLTHQENIQILKVISDTTDQSWEFLEKNTVSTLIEKQLPIICRQIDAFLNQSQKWNEIIAYKSPLNLFLDHWHFTESQRYQLLENLRRWKVLYAEQDPFKAFYNLKNAKAVLEGFRLELDKMSYANHLY